MSLVKAKPILTDVNELQRTASAPYRSVWVGASAGSGKTKVLADRVTRLLLSGVAPQKILCLTFTRAAAAEMSIRLTQRLSHWATCSEKELEDALFGLQGKDATIDECDRARRLFAEVLACPGGMRLMTIHGFAQEVLRRFPLEAGLPPHFTVMEEADATALWHDELSNVLQDISSKKDEASAAAFAKLSTIMAEGTLKDRLKDVLSQKDRLSVAIEEAGSLAALMQEARSAVGLDDTNSVQALKLKAVAEGAFNRAALLHVSRLVHEKGAKTYKARSETIFQFLECHSDEERFALFDSYVRAFFTGTLEPYARHAAPKVVDEHPEILETYQTEIDRLSSVLDQINAAQIIEETEAVLTFGLRVMDAYQAAKQRKATLDYDDLIEKANALLSRSDMAPWVLYKLDGGIDHMLVDEAQDTNPTQWQIIKTIADEYFSGEGARTDQERTLFVVGDEKQSIYSFLKADPEAFETMRAYFADKIAEAGKAYQEVPLNVSFRSAPAVLRAVDAVFDHDLVRKGVSRDPVEHHAFRATSAGRVELWPCIRLASDQKKEQVKEAQEWALPLGYEVADDPAAALAEKIALQIKSWVHSGVSIYDRDEKKERALTYGDVMVLVQKRGAFVYHLVRALKKHDVEVSGVDRMKLTQQLAVMDLLAVLQFMLLPEDDLTLATVLRSPFIGASEDDLMALAIGRKGSLWDSLRTNKTYAPWYHYLKEMTARADQMPALQMLVHILTMPCPADEVSGRRAIAVRLGPDAEDPIDELLNAAELFGTKNPPSLQAFLHWLLSTEVEVKREMEQAVGCVRIATVHGSKGLEAPVVILPDTVSAPERRQLDKILWAEGLPFYMPRTPRHKALKKLQDAALARREEEHRRLLYVAMTRAADRLYIGGFENKAAKEGEAATVSKAGSWYNLIATGLKPVHQDDVVVDEGQPLVPELVVADYADLTKIEPEEKVEAKQIELPPWARMVAPVEQGRPKPLMPSRLEDEDVPMLSPQDQRFARGRIIHRLLQNLPDLSADQWKGAAARFLARPVHDLTGEQQLEIAQEVLALLRDERFAPLFGKGSRAEQPIVGEGAGQMISGIVDRLVVRGDEVWVVDYKTNRPPPTDVSKVPAIYQKQMAAYRAILSSIYQDKKIRCFLLWTYTPQMMEVN